MWVIALLLPLNLVWWFLLKRYPGRVPLRSSGEGLATRPKVIGALGLICALACAAAGILAATENAWEVTPVFFVWSYVTLSMRAAHMTAARQPSAELGA
jgi:hypothetical protein